jgi:hypothetical protein
MPAALCLVISHHVVGKERHPADGVDNAIRHNHLAIFTFSKSILQICVGLR